MRNAGCILNVHAFGNFFSRKALPIKVDLQIFLPIAWPCCTNEHSREELGAFEIYICVWKFSLETRDLAKSIENLFSSAVDIY